MGRQSRERLCNRCYIDKCPYGQGLEKRRRSEVTAAAEGDAVGCDAVGCAHTANAQSLCAITKTGRVVWADLLGEGDVSAGGEIVSANAVPAGESGLSAAFTASQAAMIEEGKANSATFPNEWNQPVLYCFEAEKK